MYNSNNSMIRSNFFILLISFLILFFNNSIAQDSYLQGYDKEISGTRFSYHSPLPSVTNCLLTRASSEFDPIEWQTEIVPQDYNQKIVSFIWLYGVDVLSESQNFDVFINGQKYFTFSNPLDNKNDTWSVHNNNGSELTFNRNMIDRHKDQMGFAVLNIPTRLIKLGERVSIKIDGVDKGSSAWYMTFKTGLKEDVKISQTKTVRKKDGHLFYTARFDFIHIGNSIKSEIKIDDVKKTLVLNPGYNSLDFLVPKVEMPTKINAQIKIGNENSTTHKFIIKPVKKWTIYLVQHSHTDIGYTRPQTEILSEHLRYIDDALDYCDQTDNYPSASQFRWTCEASWAVREYLKSRPESQINRLLKRVKEGRIEITGMFFNFSEIVDETALAIQTKTIKDFKARGIDVTTAMQNDVNGIGWSMIDFYKTTDVKYLTMGQHGHRAQVPFNKPTSFWWESPSGNKLLAYRSEHYMHGNALALTSGYLDVFGSNLSDYLTSLEKKNYPYDRTSFQFSGYVTDNSPPSTIACNIVREWNEKYEWPKLRLALASEFMVYLDKNKADSLPTKQVAWPDWWTDGFGSAMNETKAARTTHANMIANMGILSMAKMMGAKLPKSINNEISKCYDNLLFYDEHTFGAAESITDPMSENSIIQWGEKSAYAWTAVKEASLLREKAMGFIQQFINKSNVPTISVFNTLNWSRAGLVTVYIDHEILPPNKSFTITDDKQNIIPAQPMNSRSDGTYWALWVSDVPGFGYKTLSINVSDKNKIKSKNKDLKNNFENNFYNITMDYKLGAVSKIFDKELREEIIDENSKLMLGEIIYERLDNRHSMERLTNDSRDTVYVPLKRKHSLLSNISVSSVEAGPIWNSIKIHGSLPYCADARGVNVELRLYNVEKRIELLFDMHKLSVNKPEAVYVAFPFKMKGENKLAFEVQGGTVSPGVNQLEGTASDWNTIQNFASVRTNNSQIVYCSNDIPLVQFGEINAGHFYYQYIPEKSHIYSWVLNNYWTTNFRASQEGEMKWNYQITSSSDVSNSFASRFGWGSRIPLLTRVIPSGNNKTRNVSKSIIDFNIPNLLLVNAKPSLSGKGIILQLRETEGDHAILDINKLKENTNVHSISEVSILEDEIKNLNEPLLFEHYETKFIQLTN